jgi:hypothetical protein
VVGKSFHPLLVDNSKGLSASTPLLLSRNDFSHYFPGLCQYL